MGTQTRKSFALSLWKLVGQKDIPGSFSLNLPGTNSQVGQRLVASGNNQGSIGARKDGTLPRYASLVTSNPDMAHWLLFL